MEGTIRRSASVPWFLFGYISKVALCFDCEQVAVLSLAAPKPAREELSPDHIFFFHSP